MQCYQIDFKDGTRILVDADTKAEARELAYIHANDIGLESGDDGAKIESVIEV